MNSPASQPTAQEPGTTKEPGRRLETTNKLGAIDAALLLVTVIWGLNTVVIKATYTQIPIMAFMSLRFMLASALLLLVAWRTEHSLFVHRRHWLLFVAAGMASTGLYQPLFLNGLALTTASTTALIVAASPAFVALINRLLGRELLSGRGWLGIALTFTGIVLIVEGGGGLQPGAQHLAGDLMILASTFLWACYVVMVAPLMKTYSPLRVTAVATSLGAVIPTLLGLPALLALPLDQVQWSGWAGVLYSALLAIVFSYVIWNMGVQKIGGSRTSLYTNLIPVIGAGAAAIFLGEALTPLKIAGAAIIFFGLHLGRTARVVRR
jgi:drug/metabolite transporter (DMT)-like permease